MLPRVLPICVTGVNSLVLFFGVSHGSRVFVNCRSRGPSWVSGYGAELFLLYKHALSRELYDFTPLSPYGWITPTRFLLFARRTIHTQLITSRCSLGLCSQPNRRSVILFALVARYLSFFSFSCFVFFADRLSVLLFARRTIHTHPTRSSFRWIGFSCGLR